MQENSWSFIVESSDAETIYAIIYDFNLNNVDTIELVPKNDIKFSITSSMFSTLGLANNVSFIQPIRNSNIIHVRLKKPLKYRKVPDIHEENPPELADIYFTVADHTQFLKDVNSHLRSLKRTKKARK